MGIELQFLGSGDAFGSGGRFQTCLLLRGLETLVLIDCGASSLIAMKRSGIDPSEIGCVLLTHLHGDHFGGLPFLILDGQFSRRTRPLVIAGPAGVGQRVGTAMEALFPGSSRTEQRYPISYVELAPRRAVSVGPVAVTPFVVEHVSGAPSFALRVGCAGKVVSYSGDTEWTDELLEAARGADLLICEAYFYEKKVRYHMDYRSLIEQRERLDCKRIILTHMSSEILARLGEVTIEHAEDGLVVTV